MSRPSKSKTDAAGVPAVSKTKPTGKAQRAAVRRINSDDVEPAPMQQVIIRLVYESVAARIRHRALLHVFETRGKYDHQNYLESYKLIYDRDHDALVARIMLPTTDFAEQFGGWHEEDYKKYGIPDRVSAISKREKQTTKPRSAKLTQ